jgi:hypothetical protein
MQNAASASMRSGT